ncbi:MAG: hypothetical protein Q9225_003149 [Loekoesia sp. 1 TL-2023]
MLTSLARRQLYLMGGDPNTYPERRVKRVYVRKKEQIERERPLPLPSLRLNVSESSFTPTDCHKRNLLSLPLEIRLEIYEFTLGGNLFILDQKPNRICIDRTLPPASISWMLNGPQYDRYERTNPPQDKRHGAPGFGLLLTCRQVYIEAIDRFYAGNVFESANPLILIYLQDRCLLWQRLQAIKHLSLLWTYMTNPMRATDTIDARFDWKTWQRLWDIIANQLHLTSLKAVLGFSGSQRELKIDSDWVKPMLGVKGVRQVQISIDWLNAPLTRKSQTELSSRLTESMKRRP